MRTGTVLITSRLGRGWRGVETVVLDALHPAEAVRLLTGLVRAEWPDADLADARAVFADVRLGRRGGDVGRGQDRDSGQDRDCPAAHPRRRSVRFRTGRRAPVRPTAHRPELRRRTPAV